MLDNLAAPGLFRLILALGVFVGHTTRLSLGVAAVYVFFTLSGYWISNMWSERYSKARSPYATYLISRTWRLLPTFLLCTAIAWLLLLWHGRVPQDLDWPRQLLSNLFIFGYYTLSFKPIVPAWSLDIEAQFYLIAPLVVILMRWSGWMLLGCGLLSVTAYFAGNAATVVPYLGFFAIGVAAASTAWKPSSRLGWGSLVATGALVLLVCLGPFKGILLTGAHPGPLAVFNGEANVVIGLLIGPWAIYTTRKKGSTSDGMFGDLSYIVYLLHWPILQIVDATGAPTPTRIAVAGGALATTLLGAFLIWMFFDKPVNRLRSEWVADRIESGIIYERISGKARRQPGHV